MFIYDWLVNLGDKDWNIKTWKTPPVETITEEGIPQTILPLDLGNGACFLKEEELELLTKNELSQSAKDEIQESCRERLISMYYIFRMEVLVLLERCRLLLLHSRCRSKSYQLLDIDPASLGKLNKKYTELTTSVNFSELAAQKRVEIDPLLP